MVRDCGLRYILAVYVLKVEHSLGKMDIFPIIIIVISSYLNIIGLWVPTQKLRDYPLFRLSPTFKNDPSVRSAAAKNSVCSDFDIFRRKSITTKFYVIIHLISKSVLTSYLNIIFVLFVFVSCI